MSPKLINLLDYTGIALLLIIVLIMVALCGLGIYRIWQLLL